MFCVLFWYHNCDLYHYYQNNNCFWLKLDTHILPLFNVLQVCLEGQISRKSAIRSLSDGHQPHGDQIPWKFCEQFRDTVFPSLSGARIVRIATHPSAMRVISIIFHLCEWIVLVNLDVLKTFNTPTKTQIAAWIWFESSGTFVKVTPFPLVLYISLRMSKCRASPCFNHTCFSLLLTVEIIQHFYFPLIYPIIWYIGRLSDW